MVNINVNRFHFIMGVLHGIFSLLALGGKSNCRDIFCFCLILGFLGFSEVMDKFIKMFRCFLCVFC